MSKLMTHKLISTGSARAVANFGTRANGRHKTDKPVPVPVALVASATISSKC
jgi:hypothetical protein